MSNQDNWSQFDYFPSSIYILEKPNFLETVKKVSDEYLALNETEEQLCKMSYDFSHEYAMVEFNDYVLNTAWNVLQSQGYAMDKYRTVFSSLWTQDHHTASSMAEHTHNKGAQIIGFYFLECPENGSEAMFHDPRPAKVIIALDEQDGAIATPASNKIKFIPKPGTLMFSNAWLPHSFTRNGSDSPMRFVHMNINVIDALAQACTSTTVV